MCLGTRSVWLGTKSVKGLCVCQPMCSGKCPFLIMHTEPRPVIFIETRLNRDGGTIPNVGTHRLNLLSISFCHSILSISFHQANMTNFHSVNDTPFFSYADLLHCLGLKKSKLGLSFWVERSRVEMSFYPN